MAAPNSFGKTLPIWGAFCHWSPPEHPRLLHPTYQLKQSVKRKLRRGQRSLCVPSPRSKPGQPTVPPEQAMPVSPEPYRRQSLEVTLQTWFGSEMPFEIFQKGGKRKRKSLLLHPGNKLMLIFPTRWRTIWTNNLKRSFTDRIFTSRQNRLGHSDCKKKVTSYPAQRSPVIRMLSSTTHFLLICLYSAKKRERIHISMPLFTIPYSCYRMLIYSLISLTPFNPLLLARLQRFNLYKSSLSFLCVRASFYLAKTLIL